MNPYIKSALIFFGIFLFLAVIVATGMFFWQEKLLVQKSDIEDDTAVPEDLELPKESVGDIEIEPFPSDAIEGWKSYKNEELNITFDYPEYWGNPVFNYKKKECL